MTTPEKFDQLTAQLTTIFNLRSFTYIQDHLLPVYKEVHPEEECFTSMTDSNSLDEVHLLAAERLKRLWAEQASQIREFLAKPKGKPPEYWE